VTGIVERTLIGFSTFDMRLTSSASIAFWIENEKQKNRFSTRLVSKMKKKWDDLEASSNEGGRIHEPLEGKKSSKLV
jgi:hypothetical protein